MNGPAGAQTGIDWDDEDEATTIFDRAHEDATHSLLQGGFGAPGYQPGRAGSHPPEASAFQLQSQPPLPAGVPTFPPAQATLPPLSVASKKTLILAATVLILGALVATVFSMLPGSGAVVVTAAGSGGKTLEEIAIYVDGKKRCATSPCQIEDLATGIHLIRVTAAGHVSTPDQAVKISKRDETVHNVVLERAGGSLAVRAEGRGLSLSVDGKELGPLPQELPDLLAGDHTVTIDGGDRYQPFEQTVRIVAGQSLVLEPKLKVKKGLATIKPGMNAADAQVVLVSGNERRPVPQLPLAVDIPAEKAYRIVATKPGFQVFEQNLEFEDGRAERTFIIDLKPALSAGSSAPSSSRDYDESSSSRRQTSSSSTSSSSSSSASAQRATTRNGTLTLSSIPPSNVLVDGRPLGPTPKSASVSPGTHTVIFAHPVHGRKAKSVDVAPGRTVPVSVRFN